MIAGRIISWYIHSMDLKKERKFFRLISYRFWFDRFNFKVTKANSDKKKKKTTNRNKVTPSASSPPPPQPTHTHTSSVPSPHVISRWHGESVCILITHAVCFSLIPCHAAFFFNVTCTTRVSFISWYAAYFNCNSMCCRNKLVKYIPASPAF